MNVSGESGGMVTCRQEAAGVLGGQRGLTHRLGEMDGRGALLPDERSGTGEERPAGNGYRRTGAAMKYFGRR